jgi:uncharacterized protein YxjI
MKLCLYDKKMWSGLPRYYIEINGHVVGEIVKERTFLKPKYRLDGLPWRLESDFWAHKYSLRTKYVQRIYCGGV